MTITAVVTINTLVGIVVPLLLILYGIVQMKKGNASGIVLILSGILAAILCLGQTRLGVQYVYDSIIYGYPKSFKQHGCFLLIPDFRISHKAYWAEATGLLVYLLYTLRRTMSD